MLNKIKHFIGNIFHIKKWSDNYKRNISFEAIEDAYIYVINKHKILIPYLKEYYKCRGIITHLKEYDCNKNIIPTITITKDKYLVPHKVMSYSPLEKTIYVYFDTLFIDCIMYRSMLVHEIIHHVYRTINISYGLFKATFNRNAIGYYEKNPEEFIADYWGLYYEGYNENYIIEQLAEWYINDDKDCTITREIVRLMKHYGFIPYTNMPLEARFELREKF